eukprot:TRINITY_DN14460_c0_g1_i1.p1 TRINITY_DN14460_c0_g1~~TRINITY_DN14460_c0_g1_i1.p1  ORF type:complete len:175 (+),score=37.12 TRINITY_DN14460_c0_g1_i1:271-795(+)
MIEIKDKYKIEQKSRVNNIKLRNLEDVYDLSLYQQEVLEKYLNSPTEGWYQENLVYEFKGKIDINIFKRCWDIILKRHSILRTAFLVNNLGKYVQVVLKNAEFPIEILNWNDFDEETRKQKLDKLIDEDRLCLLYTSDAADDTPCVDLGGRRIIKKKKNKVQQNLHKDQNLTDR